jgi:uncharacterized repeat protein (TIGR04138 family)
MGPNDLMGEIERIVEKDPRYKPDSYLFVINAVEFTMLGLRRRGHVSGHELLEGIKRLARTEFGPMAKPVLESWGISGTEDFGEIVFNLVEEGVLGKNEHDSRDDFKDVYDFDEVFERQYDWNIEGVI